MSFKLLFSISFSLLLFSCGILSVSTESDSNPAYQAYLLDEINNKPIAKYMDSLWSEINSSKQMIPEDLINTTIVFETYNYDDYLNTRSNKFHQVEDSEKNRRAYKHYENRVERLLDKSKYIVKYAKTDELTILNKHEFRYVIKTTNKVSYDPKNIYIVENGAYPMVVTLTFYFFDRVTGKVYSELDLSQLNK